jgi:putative nucleotidyltransferase with HDIG domain
MICNLSVYRLASLLLLKNGEILLGRNCQEKKQGLVCKMDSESLGVIVLEEIPGREVEQKIVEFLSPLARSVSTQGIYDVLARAPCVLLRNVPTRVGNLVVQKLTSFGAQAKYLPENIRPDEETSENTESDTITHSKSSNFGIPDVAPTPHLNTHHGEGLSALANLVGSLADVNKELWLILSMLVIVAGMNYLLISNRMLLGLYMLPTLFSAYYYGRRHATLTAFASILLVGAAMYCNPLLLAETNTDLLQQTHWYEIAAWGSILLITAYGMGTLYENNKSKLQELQSTYYGLIMLLRHFISQDKYTETHCYRVSIYAAKIARYCGCTSQQTEDIRAAALLHDIGKLEISRELLHKAAKLTAEEYFKMKQHVTKGANVLAPVSGPLGRVIPIVLSHHDKYDGSGYHPVQGEEIPLESRVLTVADVYDSLVSDRPYRKAMSPFEAKQIIVAQSGSEFDPEVVKAFVTAFNRGEMDIPNVII